MSPLSFNLTSWKRFQKKKRVHEHILGAILNNFVLEQISEKFSILWVSSTYLLQIRRVFWLSGHSENNCEWKGVLVFLGFPEICALVTRDPIPEVCVPKGIKGETDNYSVN